METAEFITENNKITGLRAKNIELWFAIQAIHNTVFPYCEKCGINSICSGGCLGAQYEATGSVFTPIPSVCRMSHAKIALWGICVAY
jgi:radical SAM protein with 4Fe4S-binding SPASM domain